jgi:hypothetical protein
MILNIPSPANSELLHTKLFGDISSFPAWTSRNILSIMLSAFMAKDGFSLLLFAKQVK